MSLNVLDPVAVSLAKFEGVSAPDGVKIAWETSDEFNNSHFDIYRAEGLSEGFARVNLSPITGDSHYEYTDVTVTDGWEYR